MTHRRQSELPRTELGEQLSPRDRLDLAVESLAQRFSPDTLVVESVEQGQKLLRQANALYEDATEGKMAVDEVEYHAGRSDAFRERYGLNEQPSHRELAEAAFKFNTSRDLSVARRQKKGETHAERVKRIPRDAVTSRDVHMRNIASYEFVVSHLPEVESYLKSLGQQRRAVAERQGAQLRLAS